MRRIISFFLTVTILFCAEVFLIIPANAQSDDQVIRNGFGFNYVILPDQTVKLIEYVGSDTYVSIPAIIDGRLVSTIGSSCFYIAYGKSGIITTIKTINIPEGVTNIEEGAFVRCTSLENIIFPHSLKTVAENAFWDLGRGTKTILYCGTEEEWIAVRQGKLCDSYSTITVECNYQRATSAPNTYYTFENHVYQFVDDSISWNEAKETCEQIGGHLVTVSSQDEQDFLISLILSSTKKNMWIGAFPDNGEYKWVTGEAFSYTNWAPGEPNNVFDMQNAAMMYTQNASYPAGTWNDENENGRNWSGYNLSDFGYICEWEDSHSNNQTTINFDVDSEISGTQGDTKEVLVVLDSAEYGFEDLSIASSDTDVVSIKRIGIGDGFYFPQGNEKIATIYLDFVGVGIVMITASAPDGTSSSITITSDPYYASREGFKLERDGWCFINGDKKGFNYDQNYKIPIKRYEEVFGKSYVATATANANNKVFESMISPNWGGNCFGMCATADLFYLGLLDWDYYSSLHETSVFGNIQYPNSYYYETTVMDTIECNNCIYPVAGNNTAVTQLIEKYQIYSEHSQHKAYMGSDYSTRMDMEKEFLLESSSNESKKTYKHKTNGTYIQQLFNMATSTQEPILVGLNGKAGGHCIMLRDNVSYSDLGNGWYSFPVYDPNYPSFPRSINTNNYNVDKSFNQAKQLELNPSKNLWRYVGGINSNHKPEYYGCDADEKIIYQKSEEQTAPDFLIFLKISNIGFPTEFNGDAEWKVSKDTVTLIHIPSDVSIDIMNKSNKDICKVRDGALVERTDGVTYLSNYHVKNEGNLSGGCSITIPYKEFEIRFICGSDITIIDDDSAINLAGTESMSCSVNMYDNACRLSEFERNNSIISQITEIRSHYEYTSVVVNGELSNNDAVAVSLKNNELNVDNHIQSDCQLSITTDNDASPEERVLMTLSEDTNTGESYIENVRDKNIVSNGTTGDCTWTLDDNGVLTISGNGAMGDYYTNIGTPWGTNIYKVIINSGVTNIGMGAFYDCSNLDCVIIPDSVTSIGNASFKHCTKLERVIIPKNVVSIGSSSFSECTGLLSVSFPDNLSIIDSFAFSLCTKLSDVVIPDSVKNIGEYAFYGCGMTSIDIPDGISTIECGTFSGCNMLTAVELPESVVRINDYAFNCCNSLTDIEFPNNLISIGEGAFYACLKMENFDIPDSVTGIGESAFGMCTSLSEVRLPKGLLCVSNSCFYNCENLASVIIPEGVTSIEDGAFSECFNLTHITIPNSVTSIGDNVFNGCDNLTIRGYQDTYVQTYAKKHCIPFIKITCIGDTNLDGRITISDVTFIQRYLAEMVVFNNLQLTIADVNSDGKVDINDATHLQKYLAEFDGIVLGKQPTA